MKKRPLIDAADEVYLANTNIQEQILMFFIILFAVIGIFFFIAHVIPTVFGNIISYGYDHFGTKTVYVSDGRINDCFARNSYIHTVYSGPIKDLKPLGDIQKGTRDEFIDCIIDETRTQTQK